MHVVYMTTETHISPNWWRVTNPAKHLAAQGHTVDVQTHSPYNTNDVPRGSTVVFLRASAKNSWDVDRIIQELQAKDCCIIYDTDDDIFTPHLVDHMKDMLAAWSDLDTANELGEQVIRKYILNQVDGVTVSTPALKELLTLHCIKPIVVVPNAIDTEWFSSALVDEPVRDSREVTIGWAGSGRPQHDLLPMAIAWGIVAEKYPHVNFVLGGWRPKIIYDSVPNDRIIYRPWTDLGHYPGIMAVDIGCTPLRVSEFNRCKSPIKVLEYTLAGAAVVSSPTVYGAVVDHGVNGFIASTVEEWVYYLSLLVEYPNIRSALRTVMTSTVHDHYTMKTNWHRWTDAYKMIEDMTNARQKQSQVIPVQS